MKLAEIALVAERAITKPDIARVSLVFTEINVNIKVCSSDLHEYYFNVHISTQIIFCNIK